MHVELHHYKVLDPLLHVWASSQTFFYELSQIDKKDGEVDKNKNQQH